MIYGELGRYAIEIEIKFIIIHCLWETIQYNYHELCMYSLSHLLYSQQNIDIKWVTFLEKILNETGFSDIWQT